jgi:hypothetical protein
MDLKYESQRLLEQSGYNTARLPENDLIVFEDETLIGFINVLEKADDILKTWEKSQDIFLTRNAVRLRSFPAKAWNVYSVFLSTDNLAAKQQTELTQIEEDFRGSRKIAQVGITSLDELFSALAPLLPIKNLVALHDFDSRPRLESRLSFLKPSELSALHKADAAATIMEILLEEEG